MNRGNIVDNFKTFIESDWNSIRKFLSLVMDKDLMGVGKQLPKECCGVLFYSKRALATNGHWAISCECQGDYSACDFFFYDYAADDVKLNYNPFETVGLNVTTIKSIFFDWQPYIIKARIRELIGIVHTYHKTIKEQRRVEIRLSATNKNKIQVVLQNKDGNIHKSLATFWGTRTAPSDQFFSVNCGYFTKLLKILAEFNYHIVDLCFSSNSNIVVLKGVNRRQNKIPVKIALGQYHLE